MSLLSPISVVITVYTVLLFLAIGAPIASEMSGISGSSTGDVENLGNSVLSGGFIEILEVISATLFWTFGAPNFVNYILMIPRLGGLIAIYRLANPLAGS